MKTRRLTATHEGVTYARVTHRAYAVVVVYDDGRRPTWHETRHAAERAASLYPGAIVPVQADVDSRPTATIPALTDLDRKRRLRRMRTTLKRPGVWVTGPLTRRKLYPPTTERSTR